MRVDSSLVSHVADLAHLELTGEEREGLIKDMNAILEHMDVLNELDTSPAETVTLASSRPPQSGEQSDSAKPPAARQSWRADELRPNLPHDLALVNAPFGSRDFFKVPKVIER